MYFLLNSIVTAYLFALVEKEFEEDGSNDTHDVRFAKWLLKDKVMICLFFTKRSLAYTCFITFS